MRHLFALKVILITAGVFCSIPFYFAAEERLVRTSHPLPGAGRALLAALLWTIVAAIGIAP